MKRHIYLLAILFFSTVLLGGNDMIASESEKEGKIKGSVIDEGSKQPIEYATVALFDAVNDALITGVVTDYLGHFKLDQPEKGSFYLRISFIGFEEVKSDVFSINESRKNINLGKIFLSSSSSNLDEVEIVAKKSAIEYRIDKKVINVDKQLTSEAGTAVDLLENVPSVQVDIEGNVTLRGSSGFTVLIDGKPTILEPSEVLRQIPSGSIQNIEIITNPSVKYEPDGATGIINIVTKKNMLDGFSGVVNANAASVGGFGGDMNLNYRMNKFNFVVGASYRKGLRPGYRTEDRQTLSDDTTYFVSSKGDAEREFESKRVQLGIEYDLTKNDFISLSTRFGQWNMSNGSDLLYNDWTSPETDFFTYKSLENTDRGGDYYSFNGVYQHTFPKKENKNPEAKAQPERGAGQGGRPGGKGGPGGMGKTSAIHMIKIQSDYQFREMNEESTNNLRDLNDELLGGKKNIEKGPSSSFRLNVDYTLPVKETDKFEAGLQLRNNNSRDITELWLYNEASGDLDFVDEFSNTTDYSRNIFAAYSLYAGYFGKIGYQAGLRTEFTDRIIETVGEDPFTINRWDLFPTVHLSYELPSDQQLMGSYSRRIDRPRGWWLEPFITWVDAYNVRTGNPGLQPEYIDSYELGYLKKFDDDFFSLEGYYRVTNNKVERISSVYQENVMMSRPENIGKDYSLGFEAMLNIGVLPWWNMEISGNYFNYKLKGSVDYVVGEDIVSQSIDRTSRNWNSRFNNTFRLWSNGELQLSSRYNSASVTAQGTSSDYFTLDAAFKVSFLNKNLSVNLQGRDLLGTSVREHISEGPGFKTQYKYDPESPVVMMTVSYRFNNYTVSRRSQQSGGDDGEEF